jgi:hypothetical protein
MRETTVNTLDLARKWTPGLSLTITAICAQDIIEHFRLKLECRFDKGDLGREESALFTYRGEILRLKKTWMGRWELYHGDWQPDPRWTGD